MATTFTEDKDDDTSGGAWAQAIALSFKFLFLVVAILGIGWLVSNCRIVRPDDRAIVIRLGAVVREVGAGLLIAAPKPFETVMILPSADRQLAFEIQSYRPPGTPPSPRDGDPVAQPPAEDAAPPPPPPEPQGSNESRVDTEGLDPLRDVGLIVTGDMSLVYYNATLFYKITDPQAYVLSGRHMAPALERVFQSSALAVTASRDIDTIIVARPEAQPGETTGPNRESLRADLVTAVNARLQDLNDRGAGLGIVVNRVDLVPTVPAGAKAAFDFVLTAVQKAERSANDARTVAQKTVQGSERTYDRMRSEAQARAEEAVSRANAQTAPVFALTQGSGGNGDVEDHLFRERIGALLNAAGRVYTIDQHGTPLLATGIPPR
jgi:regulator of protease activity HflC (stomatin/prohibitin superfamily)